MRPPIGGWVMKGCSIVAVAVAAFLFLIAVVGRFVGTPGLGGFGQQFSAGTFLLLAILAMLTGVYLRIAEPDK